MLSLINEMKPASVTVTQEASQLATIIYEVSNSDEIKSSTIDNISYMKWNISLPDFSLSSRTALQ